MLRPYNLLQPGGPSPSTPLRTGLSKPILQRLRIVFSLLFLFAFFPFSLFSSPVSASTVAAVIDGDTIMLTDGTRVRYLGVNTPEHGQPFYEEAKRYNERLVLHKEVRLEGNKLGQIDWRRDADIWQGSI